jgi:hypothetical protein
MVASTGTNVYDDGRRDERQDDRPHKNWTRTRFTQFQKMDEPRKLIVV